MGSSENYLQIRYSFHIQRALVNFTWFAGYINNVINVIHARAFINNSLKPTNSLYDKIVYIFT